MNVKVKQLASDAFLLNRIRAQWIKWGFGLILLVALSYQLNRRANEISWSNLNIDTTGFALIGAVVLLSMFNWSMEALKWQRAMRTIKPAFKQALETVLVGLSFAVFTPGRIGDYAGRLLHSESDDRQQALVGTFLCSMAQLTVTLIAGGVACFLLLQSRDVIFVDWPIVWLIFPLVIGLFAYFLGDKMANATRIFPIARKLLVKPIQFIPSNQKLNILALAAARYAVYVIQMLILMAAFELNIPLTDAIFGVSILFLVQTMIPMPMLFQVATKIELAVLLWAPYEPSALSLSIVMLLLWFVNVVIPALVGYRIMSFNKLVKPQKNST